MDASLYMDAIDDFFAKNHSAYISPENGVEHEKFRIHRESLTNGVVDTHAPQKPPKSKKGAKAEIVFNVRKVFNLLDSNRFEGFVDNLIGFLNLIEDKVFFETKLKKF